MLKLLQKSREKNTGSLRSTLLSRFREKRPRSLQLWIRKYKHTFIKSVTVGRNPISKNIEWVADTFARGRKIKKKYGYDHFYHLFVLVTLSDGSVHRIEKNSVVRVGRPPTTITSSVGPINVSGLRMTPRVWIVRSEREYSGGKAQFYAYNFWKHNCQAFAARLLRTLNAYTPEVEQFVMQHANEILQAEGGRQLIGVIIGIAGVSDAVHQIVEPFFQSIKQRLFGNGAKTKSVGEARRNYSRPPYQTQPVRDIAPAQKEKETREESTVIIN